MVISCIAEVFLTLKDKMLKVQLRLDKKISLQIYSQENQQPKPLDQFSL